MRRAVLPLLFAVVPCCAGCGGSAIAPGEHAPAKATSPATFTFHGVITFLPGGTDVYNSCQHQWPYTEGAPVHASASGFQGQRAGRIISVAVAVDHQSCIATFLIQEVPVVAGPYYLRFGSDLFPSPIPAAVAVGSTVHLGFGGGVYGVAG